MLGEIRHPGPRPVVTCICGSTRFHRRMHEVTLDLTLDGHIVLVVGSDDASDDELGLSIEEKSRLCALHRHKIDMADEVLVVNVGGYVGASVRDEICYARYIGKPVRFLEPVTIY